MGLAKMGDLGYNEGVNLIVDRGDTLMSPGLSKFYEGELTVPNSTSNPAPIKRNRERINAAYRERIANDPEYRKKRNDKSRRWRERNRVRIAEYNAARFDETPEVMRKAIRTSQQKYPERHKARKAVAYAVQSGKFPPAWTMVCAHCQEALAAEYHHHNGYVGEHKLDVIALCTECHGKAHWVD